MDLIGIGRAFSLSLTDRLKQRYGLSRHQIALNISHTHTGPVVAKNLRPMHYAILDETQKKLVENYAARLETEVVKVVGEAINDLEPARIGWSSGTVTFAVNRRNNKEANVAELRRDGMLKGPVDHDVPVLAVYRKDHDSPKAVVFGYACHATVLSFYQWSGDYPGFAQINLQREIPGCVAMFWAGCGADINPLPRRKVELAENYGRQLASAVQQVLQHPLKDVAPSLHTSYREIKLPLGTLPTAEQLKADAMSSNKYVKSRAELLLRNLSRGEALAAHYPYPVAVWRIGDDLHQVFLGGEVVVDYAIRLKAEFGDKPIGVAGYSNDVMAYIPSRRVLREGGYEGGGAMVYYGLPAPWAPEVENLIVNEVKSQVNAFPQLAH